MLVDGNGVPIKVLFSCQNLGEKTHSRLSLDTLLLIRFRR
jgi:hypothetical protein